MKIWSIEEETHLLNAICHYKPCGKNKAFHLISIVNTLNAQSEQKISIQDIKDKLDQYYDMAKLDELEELDDSSEDEKEFVFETPVLKDKDGDLYQEFELQPSEFHQAIVKNATDSSCSSPAREEEPKVKKKAKAKKEEEKKEVKRRRSSRRVQG